MAPIITPHTIRNVVFESGERMPMLVHAGSGMPVFDACVYAITVVRPSSGSGATIEQALRSVQFLLAYMSLRSIDLQQRFRTGRFLDLHELDDLVNMAYRPLTSRPVCRQESPLAPKVLSLERVRKRTPKNQAEDHVAISTVAIRLYYAYEFLAWVGQMTAGKVCSTLEQKNYYTKLLEAFLISLRFRSPKGRTSSNRLSLSPEQRAELLRVIDPVSADNPWGGEFVRNRNRLLIHWCMGTGIRRGELLRMGIKLINFRRNIVDIVRQPDNKKDSRKYQPNVKTRERSIGISEELAYLTHEHIVKDRSKIRSAQKHDMLFVAKNGNPLSLSAFTKIFRTLRQKHPVIGGKLSSHVLRHTWNDDFSDVADKAELSLEDERRARTHAMGWSVISKSADIYLKRRTQRLATEVSIRIQKSVIDGNKEGDLDE